MDLKALWNDDTPFGKVLAIAELVDCVEMSNERIAAWKDLYGDNEIAFGHFEPGRMLGFFLMCGGLNRYQLRAGSGFEEWEK
ncbi:hypothetical protein [Anaerospora sp.]|uniref:hypothetical protein n=1 Tax=Anaerospora sp. TaxID=1960278 RepID=UPI002899E47E|nr:hypothetical protein [Anaerospora sp.]